MYFHETFNNNVYTYTALHDSVYSCRNQKRHQRIPAITIEATSYQSSYNSREYEV